MKINQIKVGILLSYLQIGLNAVISLTYTPIMLRLLGQSEYGVYTLASSVIAYLGLLNFGLSSSYIHYYSRYKTRQDEMGLAQLNGVFLTVYLGIAVIAATAGVALSSNVSALFGATLTTQELITVRYLMLILTVNLMMSFASTVFTAYVSANEQFAFQKLLSMGKTVISPLITIPVLLLGYRSIGMAVVTTVISIAVDISNLVYCFRKLHMRISLRGADFRVVGEIASFSAFIAINSIVDQINWQVDKFILGHYHGTAETAIYGVASQINSIYISVSTAISSMFTPRVHRIVHDVDCDIQFTRLFTKIGRIQAMVLGLIGSGFILFGRPFVYFWAGPEYSEAYGITLLLIMPGTIPLIQNLGIEIQRAKNMHQFRTVTYMIMAILNVFVSIPLGHYYGGMGCALGTAISLILANGIIMNWYYSRKIHLDIRYFWSQIIRLFPAILTAVVFGILLILWAPVDRVSILLLTIGIYALLYSGLCWKFSLNPSEKKIVADLRRKVKHMA